MDIHVVDVFAETPLSGNQLAVVLDADGLPEPAMQAVAREMNFSETVFVCSPGDARADARLRIFTPNCELPFAGHPTLGAAWVLWRERRAGDTLLLQEGIGPISVSIERRKGGLDTVWMTQPAATFGDALEDRAAVAEAIGLQEKDLLPDLPLRIGSSGLPFLYIPLRSAATVDRAGSDERRLRECLDEPVCFFLFAPNGVGRLYSRMFGPHSVGIAEDPATGSASGPLGAYAVLHGLAPRRPTVTLVSEQGVKMGRRSIIHIRLAYDLEAELPGRIEVGGSVMPVLKGELLAP